MESRTSRDGAMLFALCVVLALGLVVRLYGLDFGLPALNDPDEPVFVSSALRILRTHSLNPGWFGHPGTTTIYILASAFSGVFVAGRLLHVFADANSFAEYMRADPSFLYLTGRLTIVFFAVASIFLVFVLGRRLFGRWVAPLAAALLAISPVHVRYSQLIRTDVELGFVALLAAIFSLRILDRGRRSDYVLAGAMVGVATATKWPGVVAAVAIVVASWLRVAAQRSQLRTEIPKLALAAGAALLGLLLSSPFLFLDMRSALRDVAQEGQPGHVSANGQGLLQNLWWYLSDPLVSSLTVLGLLCAFVGIVDALRKRTRPTLVLLAFPVAFLVFIAALPLRWERWITPMLPFVSLYAAAGIIALASLAARVAGRQAALTAAAVALILTIAVAVPLSLRTASRATERINDTRAVAGAWLLEHVPHGSRLLMETYAPQLPREAYRYFGINDEGAIEAAEPSAWKLVLPFGQVGQLKDLDAIGREHIDVLVLSNWFERYSREEATYPDVVRRYRTLMNGATEIYRIDGVDGKMGGPTIRVLRLQAH